MEKGLTSRAGFTLPEEGTESLQKETLMRNEMVCPMQLQKGSGSELQREVKTKGSIQSAHRAVRPKVLSLTFCSYTPPQKCIV